MKIFKKNLDEKDIPPVQLVSLITIASFCFVFVFWFISDAILSKVTDKLQSKIETGMGNKARVSYIEKEEKYLQSSQKLENGAYKIPIEQAMADVIEKENR